MLKIKSVKNKILYILKNKSIIIFPLFLFGIYMVSIILYYMTFIPVVVENINIQRNTFYIFWLFSVFVFIIPSIINSISVLFIEIEKVNGYEVETKKITLINDSGGKVITIISILLAATMVLASNKSMKIPPIIIKSVAISISLVIIGVIPLYWVESKNKIKLLIILRHLKTCFYLHSLSWVLSSLILLFQWFIIDFFYGT